MTEQIMISPQSAASHYFFGMQFWENRAKSLQNLVDAQEQRILELEKIIQENQETEELKDG